jgi:hypothetical protein
MNLHDIPSDRDLGEMIKRHVMTAKRTRSEISKDVLRGWWCGRR